MKNLEEPTAQQISDDPREPYEPPRLESEELYETLALLCGKVVGQGGDIRCIRQNRAS